MDYYNDSNAPSTGSALSSAVIRAEFDLISAAFVKVAPYTGHGGEIVAINAGGTAQESLTTTGTGNVVRATSPTLTTPNIGTPSAGVLTNCTGYPGEASQAFAASYVDAPIPQNSKSAAYTTVLTDANKHILHPTADNNARTFTIDSNANVAYPIGTTLTFVNEINTVTIAITADTLMWAGSGATGSRTLAAYGQATALKITTTKWTITGVGLS